MSSYEAQRQANIQRNQALLNDLGLERLKRPAPASRAPSTKRRKVAPPPASRSSARIAAAPSKPQYTDPSDAVPQTSKRGRTTQAAAALPSPSPSPARASKYDLPSLERNWYHWPAVAEPPTRAENGTFFFASHPRFAPNKAPLEMLSEGVFGGSYYRPVRSRTLGRVIERDWEHLPADWLARLDVPTQLARPEYEPAQNKFGVKCGQSIEEWEASGWIDVNWDVRGWFQWYERFFRGRRGDDDDRQVGRWERCVGERGRWRRALVKGFLRNGVRNVADEGVEEEDVSPVLCQTCLHWAWEMRQDYLDRVWEEGL